MDEFKMPSVSTTKSKEDQVKNKTDNEITKEFSLGLETWQQQNPECCPYKEPKWSTAPSADREYKFEVLKLGLIVEEVKSLQTKPFWMFGRLPGNDIVMAHPTISRYHAVLQYRPQNCSNSDSDEDEEYEGKTAENIETSKKEPEEGWYIYDLSSTHGTFLNKMRIPSKTYIRVNVGHMIRLGASTRYYILQGPAFDEEPESELTVTELKARRLQEEENKRQEAEKQEKLREKEGISWGMAEDADEETDLSVNPYATTNNEELFLDDPKKTLRGFFEREGLDLDYKVDEMSAGTFVCRVELPIDDALGKPLIAEICHKGKKKECVVQCALEACRILDRHGLLRQSHHEPLKRKAPTENSDDDDDFLDRTGDVERKKLRKTVGTGQNVALTYEDLMKQEEEILKQIESVNENILQYQEKSKRLKEAAQSENDDLDAFMDNLVEDKDFDKTEIRKLRVEEQRLKTEHKRLQRLIKIAKPTILPPITSVNKKGDSTSKKPMFPLFGKRNKMKFVIPRSETKTKLPEKELKSDEEEMEDEDGEEKCTTRKTTENLLEVGNKEKEITNENDHEMKSDSEERKLAPVETENKNKNDKETPTKNTHEKKILGPAFVPQKFLSKESLPEETDKSDKQIDESNSNEIDTEHDTKSLSQSEIDAGAVSKTKRNRVKLRNKERDIKEEEMESHEKYSGWLPPQNQSGDGFTSLNEKYGY